MTASQNFSLVLKLNNLNGGNITQFPSIPSFALPEGITKISETIKIVSLKAYSRIISIDPAPLPNYLLEDSDTDRLVKTLDVEWNSIRKQLNVFVGNTNDYYISGSVSLLNPAGYPYRIYNLLNIYNGQEEGYLDPTKNLAFQIQDVGYGTLQTGDTVEIRGDFIREIYYHAPNPIIVTVSPPINNFEVNNIINGAGGTVTPPDPDDNNNPPPDETGDIEDMPLILVTGNYTLQNKERILVKQNANTPQITITLPPPQEGHEVEIIYGESVEQQPIILDLNGATYENLGGQEIDPTIPYPRPVGEIGLPVVRLIYIGGTWNLAVWKQDGFEPINYYVFQG